MTDDVNKASVTLRSSRGGMVTTAIGLFGLDAMAVSVIALNGWNIVTLAIALLAAASTVVVLLDLPVSATFDETGIERVTPLRHHRIEWGEVDRVMRMRRGGLRRPGSDRFRGVMVVRGRNRTVLVDQTEDVDDHVGLVSVLSSALEAGRFDSIVQQFAGSAQHSIGPPDG